MGVDVSLLNSETRESIFLGRKYRLQHYLDDYANDIYNAWIGKKMALDALKFALENIKSEKFAVQSDKEQIDELLYFQSKIEKLYQYVKRNDNGVNFMFLDDYGIENCDTYKDVDLDEQQLTKKLYAFTNGSTGLQSKKLYKTAKEALDAALEDLEWTINEDGTKTLEINELFIDEYEECE